MLRLVPKAHYTGSIRGNHRNYAYSIPSAVNTTCPFCKTRVNFRLSWSNLTIKVDSATSTCPSCQEKPIFIHIDKQCLDDGSFDGQLFIFPAHDMRAPIDGVDETTSISEGIKKAYYSAINISNNHEWTGAAVLCRRVLEGITKSLVPENVKSKPLAAQLKALPQNIDFSDPIVKLADALRKGGNLGAHFDEDREPDQEVISLMLDVLDYLIEYIYVLPARIERLHQKIEGLSGSPSPSQIVP